MTASTPPWTPHPTSAADIRTRAALTALLLIPVGLAIGIWDGKAWGQALSTAILGALAGGVCWTVYHLVCRQNNGLIMIGGFLACMVNGRPRPVGPSWIYLLLVAGMGGLMMGAWARWRDGLPGRAGTSRP